MVRLELETGEILLPVRCARHKLGVGGRNSNESIVFPEGGEYVVACGISDSDLTRQGGEELLGRTRNRPCAIGDIDLEIVIMPHKSEIAKCTS